MFEGSMVALITPMTLDGEIDYQALAQLIHWHIVSKTDAIVVAGTTGESATFDHEEHAKLIRFAVKTAAKRVPIIAGTGTNVTKSTMKLVKNAEDAGADGCLIVTPYYNKPSQNGLYHHYKEIADASRLPIILYNVPGRTCCDLHPETVEKLSKHPQIIGIKEATAKIERAEDIIRRCGQDFLVLSGDDATAFELMQHGAKGVISVTANVAPQKMHDLCQAALHGKMDEAKAINQHLSLLHERLFLESNPIPAKWALYKMGKIKMGIRMPLLPLDERYHQGLEEALKQAGVY